jgi:hypothetical protein
MIQKSDAWYGVACREIRNFILKPQKGTKKQNIKAIFPVLQKSSIIDECPLPLACLRDASELANTLQKFESNASRHLCNGGSFAKVLVGRFRFDATDGFNFFGLNRAQLLLANSRPDIVFSRPATTSIKLDYEAGVHNHVMLAITMASEKSKMLVSAKLEAASSTVTRKISQRHPKILIDIRAISSAILLQMRDIKVKPDGSQYESGSGLYSEKTGRGIVKEALAAGVLCVLLVRDEVKVCSDEGNLGVTVNALNLDRVRAN